MNYSWMGIVKSLISTHDMDLPEHLVINRWYYPYPDNRCVGIGFFINQKSQFVGLIEDDTKYNLVLNADHIKYYTHKIDEDYDVIIPVEIDEASFFQLSLIHDISDITYDNVKDLFILYNKMYNYFI